MTPPVAWGGVHARAAAVAPRSAARCRRAATPRLALAPCDPAAVERLRAALGCSRTFAQVLVRRGLADAGRRARVPRAPRSAHDPRAFAGIDDAVALILRHVAAGSRITVHGDYDVDGVCATADARCARCGGSAPTSTGSCRAASTTATASRRRPSSGSPRAGRAARHRRLRDHGGRGGRARARGSGSTSSSPTTTSRAPTARCPTRRSCTRRSAATRAPTCARPASPTSSRRRSRSPPATRSGRLPTSDLDLVALATIADLVPLRGENRRLVRAGLRALASTGKPGLRALMRVARVDPSELDARSVGFRLAPRINAAGRLHRADAGVELLLTERRRARRGDRRGARRARTPSAASPSSGSCSRPRRRCASWATRPAYVLAGEGWHPGVIGIVASRIVERHHRPAILIALDADELDRATGSGRSIPAFDLLGGAARRRAAAGALRRPPRRGRPHDRRRRASTSCARRSRPTPRRRSRAEDLVAARARRRGRRAAGSSASRSPTSSAQLEPTGMGNPGVNLLVPGARARRRAHDGGGGGTSASPSRPAAAAAARSRSAATAASRSSPARPPTPPSASSATAGTAPSSRACACATPQPLRPGADRGRSASRRRDGVARRRRSPRRDAGPRRAATAARRATPLHRPPRRRRRSTVLRELVDAAASAVLAARRRRPAPASRGLQERAGGFALCSHAALARDAGSWPTASRTSSCSTRPRTPDEDARMRQGAAGTTPT